jgi:hypothetical protein
MSLGAGCSTQGMTKADKGTAVGAGTGAVAGAVVGGPVGAVVGAGVGAYAGNAAAGGPVSTPEERARQASADSPRVARVQQALNDRGFNAGPVDGRMGTSTARRAASLPDGRGAAGDRRCRLEHDGGARRSLNVVHRDEKASLGRPFCCSRCAQTEPEGNRRVNDSNA